LRARCSGLILGLYKTSVIDASPLLVKDRYQNAGHEIDQIGACRCVHWATAPHSLEIIKSKS
jgi:hypothetical protein